MTTITATEQTGLRVLVAVSGLGAETLVDHWTIWRDDLMSDRAPVRGYYQRTDLVDVAAIDYEAPLARPVFYVLEITRTDLTRTEHAAGPVQLDATHPILSNPVLGTLVVLAAVETWPELAYNGRTQVIPVIGRTAPVVVSDAGSLPSSHPVLRTDDVGTRVLVRALFMSGQVVQLRAPEVDVEDAYLAVVDWAEVRVTNNPLDVRRRHNVSAYHAAAPGYGLAAIGDTLADLEAAVPGTLADIEIAFPGTLFDIATTDLATL